MSAIGSAHPTGADPALETAMTRRTNEDWLTALRGSGERQAAALAELRTYVLRAALFSLQRSRLQLAHLGPTALGQLAEDCAQEALTTILQRLADFRGESLFTTWAYTVAVNVALVAARRERWASVSLDAILDGTAPPAAAARERGPTPEGRALQSEAIAAIREGIERHLTPKQQQVLRAVVFEQVPLDELVRHWGSNRNAVYKLLHDARRKLKRHLVARGFDIAEILDLFAPTG